MRLVLTVDILYQEYDIDSLWIMKVSFVKNSKLLICSLIWTSCLENHTEEMWTSVIIKTDLWLLVVLFVELSSPPYKWQCNLTVGQSLCSPWGGKGLWKQSNPVIKAEYTWDPCNSWLDVFLWMCLLSVHYQLCESLICQLTCATLWSTWHGLC